MMQDEKLTRLNKFISHNTKFSRREADKLIKNKKITINNKIITDLSTKINKNDVVRINGKIIKINKIKASTVIVYNKQKGEIVSKKDPQGRTVIFDTIPKKFNHFIPIGRLDYASEGVLLLTDDIKIANLLMHSNLERIYKIKIAGAITERTIEAMKNGLILDDATAGAYIKTNIKNMKFAPFNGWMIQKNTNKFSVLKVSISEGKNRELRRFFAHFNTPVMDLKRINFGGIELNNLPSGKIRYLTKREYRDLKDYLNFLNKQNSSDKNSKNFK
jgi:23S rRNA pseudouridine2605 synthase